MSENSSEIEALENSSILTKCINDDSDGSILENWQDSEEILETENQENQNFEEKELFPVEKSMENEKLADLEKPEPTIKQVHSEYLFDNFGVST